MDRCQNQQPQYMRSNGIDHRGLLQWTHVSICVLIISQSLHVNVAGELYAALCDGGRNHEVIQWSQHSKMFGCAIVWWAFVIVTWMRCGRRNKTQDGTTRNSKSSRPLFHQVIGLYCRGNLVSLRDAAPIRATRPLRECLLQLDQLTRQTEMLSSLFFIITNVLIRNTTE